MSADFSRVDVTVHVTGWENTGCGNNDNFDQSKDDSFVLQEDAHFNSYGPTEQRLVSVNLTNVGDINGGDTIKGGITFTLSRAVGLSQLTLENFRQLRASGSIALRAVALGTSFDFTQEFDDELFVSTLKPRAEKTIRSACKNYGTVMVPQGQGAPVTINLFARSSLRLIAELQPDLSVQTQRIVSAVTSRSSNCASGASIDDYPGEMVSVAAGESQPQSFSVSQSGGTEVIRVASSSGILILHNEQAPTVQP